MDAITPNHAYAKIKNHGGQEQEKLRKDNMMRLLGPVFNVRKIVSVRAYLSLVYFSQLADLKLIRRDAKRTKFLFKFSTLIILRRV